MGTTAQRLQKPNAQSRRHKPKNRPKECGFEQFGWFGLGLLESEAFRALSANSRRLLDRLVIEHIHHGGVENGLLIVTHDQLRDYGLTASSIRDAIDECVAFGLIRCKQGGRWAETNRPNRYRLTWIGCVCHTFFGRSTQGFTLELCAIAFVSLRLRRLTPPGAPCASF